MLRKTHWGALVEPEQSTYFYYSVGHKTSLTSASGRGIHSYFSEEAE